MHYVIVGNGVAGTCAALTIRRHRPPSEATITLIGDETPYFFSRTALMYAYMNQLSRRDLEPYEREVYDRQQIDRIHGRVVDLDARFGNLTLDDGTTVEFDRCLLAVGAQPRMLSVDGIDDVEEGLVTFVSMQDLDECERLTWTTDRAVVVGGGLIGVELAECFNHHGMDVTFLVREPYYWPAAFSRPEGEMISDHIRTHGVDVRHDKLLKHIDVDDDGRVCAIHTDGGERIPCQMLGITIGVTPHVHWLKDVTTPPAIEEGIRVDRSFQTSLPDVFAAGDCAVVQMDEQTLRHQTIWYEARLHGELAARSMIGQQVHFEAPTFYNSSKFFDVEYTTVGDVADLPAGTPSLYRKMPGEPISQRIVYDPIDNSVIGFSMLGSAWDHRVLIDWVERGRTVDWVREHLSEAQFDAEFDALDLEAMNEQVRQL